MPLAERERKAQRLARRIDNREGRWQVDPSAEKADALGEHTGPYGAVGLYLPYIYPISTLYLPYIYLWCGRPGESLPEP